MSNPFSIQNVDGAPRLLKDGKVVFPLFFWQTEIEPEEAQSMYRAGIRVFSCFRSSAYFEHPYWTGENEYDFSWYDEKLSAFFEKCPDAYLIPRLFVCAPYWWVEKHPEDRVGFASGTPEIRNGSCRSTFHESFASELWKEQQGAAFRVFLRHLRSMPWKDRIIGIHVAGGGSGEWECWTGGQDADCGAAMARRCGAAIPPPEERGEGYYRAFYSAGLEAVDHFCRIVKEETDYLTIVFWGYFSRVLNPCNRHRLLRELLELPSVDILSAPHEYSRRVPGQDGFFRAYPASIARHGKLFFDEGDDRTMLGRRAYPGVPENLHDGIHVLRREFGNMITYNTGMWYMDIDNGMFRAPEYRAEIARAVRWGERSLRLPCRRVSEVAILCDEEMKLAMPAGHIHQVLEEYLARHHAFPEFLHAGAPADLWLASDISAEDLQPYKVIAVLDSPVLTDRVRGELKKLQNSGRVFLWGWGSGGCDPASGSWSREKLRDLTGLDFDFTEKQQIPPCAGMENRFLIPGMKADPPSRDLGNWSAYDISSGLVPAGTLRGIFRRAGVFLYCESGDVLSVSESALMLHASCSGEKHIRLPKAKTVTDMVHECVLGREITGFSFSLEKGETALFELA